VVLRRVRAALGRNEGVDEEDVARREAAVDDAAAYRRRGDLGPEALVALFAERAGEYRVTVREVAAAEVPEVIGAELGARGVRSVAAPADLPESWRVPSVRWVTDGLEGVRLDTGTVDGCDAVVTGCALAIAETGTILFDGGARQGRRLLTLLPDVHVCVVARDQIVQTVAEAVAASSEAARRGAPITLVSGPSATSDIELERVEGVHGPRTLIVLLVA
jgi:L-lactate dehydrogenase complex protein LldG